MMRMVIVILFLILSFLLVACGAAGNEPAALATEERAPAQQATAVATASDAGAERDAGEELDAVKALDAGSSQEVTPIVVTRDSDDAENGRTPARQPEEEDSDLAAGSVQGVEIELEQVKPAPPESLEPRPMPAPGRPNPEVSVIQQAKEDLAERLGVDINAIEVVSAEEVDWPDASLGCPREGMLYAQVITPGSKIILSYAGEQYEYHTGWAGPVILCGEDGHPVPR